MSDLVTFPDYLNGFRQVQGEDMNELKDAVNSIDSGTDPVTQVTLSGSTSGTTVLKSSAVASGTVTLPAATDTLVGKATTDALTNKTINGLTITTSSGTLTIPNSASLITAGAYAVTLTATATTGVTLPTTGTLATLTGVETLAGKTLGGVFAGGSALTVTAALHASGTILLNTAGGTTITLPAATGTGNVYKFKVSVSTTSAAHKILTVGTDYIIGIAMGFTGSTAKVFASPAATNRSIQMPNAGSQPSGGILGDYFTFTDAGSALWIVDSMYQAGTTPTTPFSAATT